MPDTDNGKFCGQCSKEVVDFTAMSKEEVLNHLSKKRTCGIFRKDQLDRVHEPIVHIRPKKSLVRLAVASLSVFVLSIFGCNDAERDYDNTSKGNESCNKAGVKKGQSRTTLGEPRPMEVLVGDSIEVDEVEPIPNSNSSSQKDTIEPHDEILDPRFGEVVIPVEPEHEVTAGVPMDEPMVVGMMEIMPEFPGGEQKLQEFLIKNLKYPRLEEKNKVEGRVILEFDIEASGNLNNIVIKRGVSEAIDKEAIRVMKLMPNWSPGYQNGKPATVAYTLPIQFSLDKD